MLNWSSTFRVLTERKRRIELRIRCAVHSWVSCIAYYYHENGKLYTNVVYPPRKISYLLCDLCYWHDRESIALVISFELFVILHIEPDCCVGVFVFTSLHHQHHHHTTHSLSLFLSFGCFQHPTATVFRACLQWGNTHSSIMLHLLQFSNTNR